MADIVPDRDAPVPPKSAQPVAHVDALPPGTRLAEFEVQGLLGVGGFGMVYRAYDHSLHRTVAIKEYMPAALAARQNGVSVSLRSSADQATYQSGLQSFVAEARLLARFDHPSLVKVYRFWEANNTAYMVMPLYSGVTLKQARAQMAAPPPEAWLRTVLWSVLQALQLLHEHDTLHRDVSPDNIFLQDMGPPVLLDLGAARRAISDKSHKHTAILKVNFAPIEQYADVEDLHQGPWTDLYALGAVVYSCLRNDAPLPATVRVIRDSMPSMQSVAATVSAHFGLDYSEPFVRAITHAMAVQPADRPQSVHDLVEEMGLQAPAALNKFDWRAALGVDLLPDLEETSRSLWVTQPQTVPNVAPQDPGSPAPGRRTLLAVWRSGRRGRQMRWLALATVAAAGLVWVVAERAWLLGEVPLVAAPELAAMPVPPAPQPVAPAPELLLTAQPPATAASPPDGAPAEERGGAASESEPQVPAPATQPVPLPAPPVRQVEEAPQPVQKTKAPPQPVTKPRAKPADSQPAPVRPLCADANFLYRPMCIHLECQKAENASRPVCIENRRLYPDGRSPGQP